MGIPEDAQISGESKPTSINVPKEGEVTEAEHGGLEHQGGYDALQTKKLVRKIDWVLIPFLALLYLLSFLDRTSKGSCSFHLPLFTSAVHPRMTPSPEMGMLTQGPA